MRIHRIGLVAGLLLLAQLIGTSCVLVPKIEDRNVLLVVSKVQSIPIHATGATNSYSGTTSINLADSLDFAQIVDDAGIDAGQLEKVVIGKVEYRVAVPDANASRAIANGLVQVSVAGAAPDTLFFTGQSVPANAVTPWTSVGLHAAGVTQLNGLLAAVLADVKNGTHVANEHISAHVQGDSSPMSVATDFWYEVRLTLIISGTVSTKVVN